MSSPAFSPARHRRQQNAVVVDVSLVAKDRDLKLGRVAQNLFHAGHTGHAVSYHDQLFHDSPPGLAFCAAYLYRAVLWRIAQSHRYGALFVVRFARNRIKRALRDLVRIGFRKVKRHEHLAWRNDLRDPQLDVREPVHAAR